LHPALVAFNSAMTLPDGLAFDQTAPAMAFLGIRTVGGRAAAQM
jgi:hypothetical protein